MSVNSFPEGSDIADFDAYSGLSPDLSNEDDDDENIEDVENEIYLKNLLTSIDDFIFDRPSNKSISSQIPTNLQAELQIWRNKFQEKAATPDSYKSANKPQPIIQLESKMLNIPRSNQKMLPKLSINNNTKRIERITLKDHFQPNNRLDQTNKQLILPPLSRNKLPIIDSTSNDVSPPGTAQFERKTSFNLNTIQNLNSSMIYSNTNQETIKSLSRMNSLKFHSLSTNLKMKLPTLNPNG